MRSLITKNVSILHSAGIVETINIFYFELMLKQIIYANVHFMKWPTRKHHILNLNAIIALFIALKRQIHELGNIMNRYMNLVGNMDSFFGIFNIFIQFKSV